MTDKLLRLPDQPTMRQVLLATFDDPHFAERFYPLIERHAGELKRRSALPLMLALCAYDYTKDMPQAAGAVDLWLPTIADALAAASTPETATND